MQDLTTSTIILKRAFSSLKGSAPNKDIMQVKKILVPVNGTDADREAIKMACRIVKGAKGRVYVTYVIQIDRTLPLDAEIKPEIEKGEKVLDQAETCAEEQDYKCETDMLQAREIGPAIVDEAIERSVDMIVLGMSYRKRFGGFNLGSTIPYVLKNAPCWVLICREPMPREETKQA